ncbi:MAG: FAD-binding protein [Variovorax sp.]|nr:FAD-binding protein [Variovorax sp.]
MGIRQFDQGPLSGAAGSNQHTADVLVIGGGPAGTWAAVSAAAQGARVVLADKGFCGTSGATAPSGTGLWHVSPDGAARESAKASRYAMGGELAEHAWMDSVLEQTWDNVERLKEWGYPFPADDEGRLRCTSLQGPEYMRLMRKQAKAAGARILDHSPALELLVDEQGTVCGATGVNRQSGDTWVVRAGAVVIATGGCAFLSKALGCNVLTGDGLLMAAEVGASLSGMEFSNAYGLGPAFSSVTKSLFYNWATFYAADGTPIEGAGSSRGRSVIAQTLQTQPVFACIDRADAQIRAWMRVAQPNFFVSFDRQGIDPFTQHFPVALRLEGTVRGTGGLHLVDEHCSTSVAGLYAAGDAATRELICGGFTGGGSHNAAWAMSSGFWAGAGAAAFGRAARSASARIALRAGGAGLGRGDAAPLDSQAVIQAVQDEVFPFERNWFREGDLLRDSLGRLDALWARLRSSAPTANAVEAVRTREAAAMLATSRWMYRSALQRTETRGMHRRREHTGIDPAQRHRLLSGGLDEVWVQRHALTEEVHA